MGPPRLTAFAHPPEGGTASLGAARREAWPEESRARLVKSAHQRIVSMSRSLHLPCVTVIVLFAATLACGGIAAQPAPAAAPPAGAGTEAPPPPGLEPLPEIAGDAELEPQVTIKRRGEETVEEARVNGRIVWIKVTPGHGRPYYLIPSLAGNTYIRRDSLDSGLSVPMWVLFTF
jgi:hypothetical protein